MFNSFFKRARSGILLFLSGSVLIPVVLSCSVSGPPFRTAPDGEQVLPVTLESGYYRFVPKVSFFDGPQLGEVYFSQSKSREKSKGLFYLRILGRDRKGAIRVRQYEGHVARFGNQIELRSQRCYLFGKREWDDRMTPLKRWECDHLVFVFESATDFTRVETLEPVPDHPRHEFSEWFEANPLQPMPAPIQTADATDRARKQKSRPIYFAGQIFPVPAGEILPDSATVVVWGFNAGRVLRDGQTLEVHSTPDSAEPGNAFIGKLKIISRPGDFLLCSWVSPPSGGTTGIAFTRESLLNQGGGLFD